MSKILNGSEISLFIKERQTKEVRSLKQSKNIQPCLVIIRSNPNPVTNTYVNLKARYAEDIGVLVKVIDCSEDKIESEILECNNDDAVHGVIVQLPLLNTGITDDVLNLISPEKDVDGLGNNTYFDPATPTAINWLLAGYNIDLLGKKIVIVGGGRLVGQPLSLLWQKSGYDVTLITSKTNDKESIIKTADIIVSATGSPGLITNDLVKNGAVVVDAGVATDSNGLVGDVSDEVRNREDISITPPKGGVGPLTVAALFHNLLVAARKLQK